MDTQQETTFDQDLSTIVAQLPKPIRVFFASGKVEIVTKNLMQKNQLRVDQAAIVEREIILLLLGLKNPDEFMKALTDEAKLGQQTVSSIVQDVNAQIFIPLRKEEEEQSRKPAMPAMPPVRPQPVIPIALQREVPDQSGSYFHLENKIPVPSAPKPVMPSALRPAVAPSVVGPRPVQGNLPPKAFLPRPAMLNARTPLPANRMLEDHEEPSPSFKPAVPTAPVAAAPRIMPPPNLPGALRPSEALSEGGMPSVNELAEVTVPEAPHQVAQGAIVHPPLTAPVREASVPVPPAIPLATPPLRAEASKPTLPPVEPPPVVAPRVAVPTPTQSKSHDPYREPIDEPVSEM